MFFSFFQQEYRVINDKQFGIGMNPVTLHFFDLFQHREKSISSPFFFIFNIKREREREGREKGERERKKTCSQFVGKNTRVLIFISAIGMAVFFLFFFRTK